MQCQTARRAGKNQKTCGRATKTCWKQKKSIVRPSRQHVRGARMHVRRAGQHGTSSAAARPASPAGGISCRAARHNVPGVTSGEPGRSCAVEGGASSGQGWMFADIAAGNFDPRPQLRALGAEKLCRPREDGLSNKSLFGKRTVTRHQTRFTRVWNPWPHGRPRGRPLDGRLPIARTDSFRFGPRSRSEVLVLPACASTPGQVICWHDCG